VSIYSKKQRWKLWLSAVAMIIIGVSLWYTRQLVSEIAQEERKKVELWADAVRNRATLVSYTERLFERLQKEERKRAEIWAQATQNLSTTEDDDARSFYLNVVSENNTIPAIIVDQFNRINYITNVDTSGFGYQTEFTGKVRQAFSNYRPIVIDDGFSNIYYIYYQDSRVFTELKDVLDNIIKSFISEVVINSASVPVIITDSSRTKIIATGNIDSSYEPDTLYLLSQTKFMESENNPLEVELTDYGHCYIFYQNSALITTLKYYPVAQIGVIGLFIIIAYFLFNFSRRAEQNQVWVGMSKETAHQLGTPLSSLIAWMEILKLKGVDDETLLEMGKDIKRLEIITERFSKIGSVPEMHEQNVLLVLRESVGYMKPRVPKKVEIHLHSFDEKDVFIAKVNIPLFDWVIENLLRNAIDAMEGAGTIDVEVGEKGNYIYVDITDTGKGISKSNLKTVFEPGYTSKKRGWGLGLSLAKRIIENYHKGKIFVRKSDPGKGTTFRILLERLTE